MAVATVIMAGGRGQRFWPSSRENRPKQFLALDGQQTLLQHTARRADGLCPSQSTWVVTREDYAPLIEEQLPQLPSSHVLLEPEGRDTAACIALAAIYVSHTDPDAVMVMLPADQLIVQEERFRDDLRWAISLASAGEHLVTLGIRPTRPETAYGYIRTGERYGGQDRQAYRVAGFTEKPLRDVAVAYLQTGGYLWNSGIFVWKASVIKRSLEQHLPELMASLAPLEQTIGTARESHELRRIYPTLPKISIDYGLMERTDNALVIPVDFGWDDLGTWEALERILPVDSSGNIAVGRVLSVDTHSSILYSRQDRRLLAVVGLSDVIVVDTEDVVLVANKSRASDLKAVVGRLEAEGLAQYLRYPTGLVTSATETEE